MSVSVCMTSMYGGQLPGIGLYGHMKNWVHHPLILQLAGILSAYVDGCVLLCMGLTRCSISIKKAVYYTYTVYVVVSNSLLFCMYVCMYVSLCV